jgi:hypothetical protein
MDLEPDRFDPIVAKSPMKVYSCFQVSALIRADSLQVQTDGIRIISPLRVRELVEPGGPRLFEINPDDGESPEGGIHDFMLPQPITDRMPGTSPLKESLRMRAGMGVIAQSTPTTLPRGQQQFGQAAFRKPKVTFAATPFKEKETVRSGPNEVTPGGGTRRRTIFEDDLFGTKSAWKRTPEKGPEKHAALIGVRKLGLTLHSGGHSRHQLTTTGLERDSGCYCRAGHTSVRGCGGRGALCAE